MEQETIDPNTVEKLPDISRSMVEKGGYAAVDPRKVERYYRLNRQTRGGLPSTPEERIAVQQRLAAHAQLPLDPQLPPQEKTE